MGKGDKKSKRGKINRGTYGKRRRRKSRKYIPEQKTDVKPQKTEVKEKVEEKEVVKEEVPEVKTEKKKTTRKKTTKKTTKKEKEGD